MEVVFSSILVVLIMIYGFKAYRLYPSYKNSIYQTMIPNFMEYFFKVVIRQDLSTSSYLKQKIGPHRMTFTTLQNNDHKITSRFVVLIYNKGLALISFLDPHGTLSGKGEEKHWFIRRETQTAKIANPIIESNKYILLLRKKYPDLEMRQYIAIANDSDISKVNADYPVCHYEDIFRELSEANTHFIEESEIEAAFEAGKNQ